MPACRRRPEPCLAARRPARSRGAQRFSPRQMSGAVTERPALHDALEFARRGDTLIVWKLDRLARSMKQLIETVENPAGEGYRVSQPDRSPRHDDGAGAAGFSYVWRAGRIRAQPDPGAARRALPRRGALAIPEAVRRNSRTTTSRPARRCSPIPTSA